MTRRAITVVVGIGALLAACGGESPSTSSGTSGAPSSLESEARAGIAGVVADATTGSVLSGVAISDGNRTTTTASDGTYSLTDTAGVHTVTATKEGYASASKQVTFPRRGTTTVNWQLSPTTVAPPPPTGSGAGISGIVRDIRTGAALGQVTIGDGAQAITTAADGSYSLSETAGAYTLTASASGYLTTSQVATVPSSGGTTVNWSLTPAYGSQAIPAANMSYVILAWNDLGMHCDQDDYSYFMVLPPFNTLHAQVVRRGGDASGPIMSGVTVSYAFPKKTNSALHTNFWKYASQYGFGNLATNVGISGTPLAGNMVPDANNLSWVAQGIPITPYDDDGTWDPYGTATITVKDSSGNVLQDVDVVAPVSTEMMCSNCHGTTNPQLDILQKHDAHSGTTLASDQAGGKVHACSECHSDNAIGAPGKAGVESLSLAMHNFHKDKMQTTATAAALTPDCYNCHPGPKTECLRGIMARAGKTCHDCHGDMNAMTAGLQGGRRAWLDEPRCGDCHGAKHQENAGTLYRNSVLTNSPDGDMNGRFYCEACHNGTHGEHITSNPADPTVPKKFQGDDYWIWSCRVCHTDVSQGTMHR